MQVAPVLAIRKLVPWILTGIACAILTLAGAPATAAPREGGSPPSRTWDDTSIIDANQIGMFVTNMGSFAMDCQMGNAGLVYPAGTGRTAVYAAGLWMGARVAGAPRVTVAEYSFEYTPGRILSPTQWADPYDPSYRVYKIAPGDTPQSNPDYAEWPVDDGAPVDALGHPRHLGAQTLWSVYNDLDPGRHHNNAGGTAPLGLEVRNTTFALGTNGAARTTIFMEWKIINKGTSFLQDAYIGVWSDPDLGGATDDLVGCDPGLSLGYCYNATNGDAQYGASPPAVGFQLVQGPIVPSPGSIAYVSGRTVPNHRNLPMTAFTKYVNGSDPSSPQMSYFYMQGLNSDGGQIINPVTSEVTTFMVSGDPVAGEGWLDSNPADRRMMISAGPFNMAPGDTQTVAAAVIIGQGLNRLASVSALRNRAEAAPSLFRSIMDGDQGACCLSGGACIQTTIVGCSSGEFFPGQECNPGPCSLPSGACCFDNGTCLILAPEQCSGRYQGNGSTCGPGACPVYGPPAACCFGTGTCELLSEYDCGAQGGTYLADFTCDLLPPGDILPGWQHNNRGNPMIDELAGAGGVPVPPDSHGGPGNDVWHSRNSTVEWWMSAGGGDGGEARFTRNGADLANLTQSDVILRWDNRHDNIGWWQFDNGEVGRIPFGLYERDPFTGQETRLIPLLTSYNGTAGVYDLSSNTPDPYTGFPATDWVYAYRFDPAIATYEQFVQDAQDGQIDNDPTTVELFARMILASDVATLPAEGTVIQFTTNKSGILAGSGFAHAVPLSWPAAEPSCVDRPQYEIYRNAGLIGTTERTDFLDLTGLSPGVNYDYVIRTRNPYTGETSEASIPIPAVPGAEGYAARSGPSGVGPTIPRLDGVVNAQEWARATRLDATFGGPRSTISLMNDARYLYIAVEDGLSADDVRIYIDSNGNGVFDLNALEGMISLDHGLRRFTRLQGNYPSVQVVGEIVDPKWVTAVVVGNVAEIRLFLYAGPLADRSASGVVPFFFHSAAGSAVYPPGPSAVLAQAPGLFARVQLASAPPPGPPVIRFLSRPTLDPNKDLTLAVEVTNGAAIASVECLYRSLGRMPGLTVTEGDRSSSAAGLKVAEPAQTPGLTARPMLSDDSELYGVTIPGAEVTSTGLVYRVRVTGIDGLVVESQDVVLERAPVGFETPLAYPNPFRSGTAITYGVTAPQRLSLGIFGVNGTIVRRLATDIRVEAGTHSLAWDGCDDAGRAVPSGVYYARIWGETFRADRTITVLR
jgi:hypothetical protein